MEIKFTDAKWNIDERGTWVSILVPPQSKELAIKTVEELDGEQVLTIKKHREKRSLNANSYCWVLLNEMANVLRTSKEEVYLQMLKRYGQVSVVSVVEDATPTFLRAIKYYDIFNSSELNGKVFNHIKVYAGSSTFDSKEMAIFIDGVVSECKELGIETDTPDEIARLKASWGGD